MAWFQGAAEFGPRAGESQPVGFAGPYVKENLNDYVKHRERSAWRWQSLKNVGSRIFSLFSKWAFLTTMATANDKGRKLSGLLPGFLLPGNLVRLHVVRSTDNPLFWKLLNDAGRMLRGRCW